MLEAKRLENLEDLKALERRWNHLLASAQNDSIFMTWEWLFTWWETYGHDHELWWLLVEDEHGKLCGGAPFYVRSYRNGFLIPHRELRFIGTGAPVAPEHLDLISLPETKSEVSEAVGKYLMDHLGDWDVLLLTDITQSTALVHDLKRELLGQGTPAGVEAQTPNAPYISLPRSWDSYFATLGKRMRAHISRHRRKAERELSVVFEVWAPSHGGLRDAFKIFEELFAKRKIKAGIGNKFDEAPGYRDFHYRLIERFAKRGWLYLAFLKSRGRTLASEYNFHYRNRLYSYQFGFDPEFSKNNVFKVLRSYIIEHVIDQGVREFDLLRGEETYKSDWRAVPRQKTALRSFSPSFNGTALRGLLGLRRAGGRAVRKLGLMEDRVRA